MNRICWAVERETNNLNFFNSSDYSCYNLYASVPYNEEIYGIIKLICDNYRSSIKKEDAEFNGVTIQSEKEIVLILVTKDIRKKVMQEISKRTHLQEKGNGVCFCLPVNEIKGLTPFEKKSMK